MLGGQEPGEGMGYPRSPRPSARISRGNDLHGIQVCVLAAVTMVSSCARQRSEPAWPAASWPTSTPEEQGMDSAGLAALDSEFSSGRHGYIDGMLVIRHGHAVFDRSYINDYVKLFEGK